MKFNIKIIFFILLCFFFSCSKLDIPPMNIVQDKEIFTNEGGINAYMARLYSEMPIEDFRYNSSGGFNNFYIKNPFEAISGEALSRYQLGASPETASYWSSAYKLIREINYFIETLPKYSGNFDQNQINNWLGEAYFIRGFTYFELVKRYGGVPIVDSVLSYQDQSIQELSIPTYAERDVYDFIANDLDSGFAKMSTTSIAGRANKYVAAAFKSRVMLFAGSIANYNQSTMIDKEGNRLCGIPKSEANKYYKLSYNASVLLEGQYRLYEKGWAANDKEAQFENYVNLFFDPSSPENIFIKQYDYPNSVHGYDSYFVPRQLRGGSGYSAAMDTTIDLVEMYDRITKNSDGTIKTLDGNGHYVLYNHLFDLFSNAEPRLRATVILPGDEFKGEQIEIRRGIYTGAVN